MDPNEEPTEGRTTVRKARLTLLGRASFETDGVAHALPDKAYAMAAILALSPEMTASRARLRGLLWGDFEHEQATANLRQMLSRVQRLQAGAGVTLLVISGLSVRLSTEDADIDLVHWLDAPLFQALRDRDERLHHLIRDFGGELLEDIDIRDRTFDDWLGRERAKLRSNLTMAATALFDEPDGDPDAHLETAGALLRVDPTQEAAYRTQIRILGRRGDISGCRNAYLACKRALKSELGATPSPLTLELARQFFETGEGPASAAAPLVNDAALLDLATSRLGPRIALLPPLEPTGEPRLRQLALSLLEEVTIGLSRYRSFRILANHTAVSLARGAASPIIDRGLCDYIVTSAIMPGRRDDYRLTLRLTRPTTGEVTWFSETPFRPDDLSSLFNQVVDRMVASLANAVERTEITLPLAAEDATAYRLFLEGARQARSTDLQGLRRARRWFNQAARREGGFGPSFAGLARTKSMEWLIRGGIDTSMLTEALQLGDQAIESDPSDGRGFREKGFASLYLKRHDESLGYFSEAVQRNPNDADLLIDYADALAHSGQPQRGLEEFRRAMDLNPVPPTVYRWLGGSIFYQMGRYQEALDVLDTVRETPATARLLAACAAKAGDLATARRHAKTVRETFPDFRTADLWSLVPDRNRADTEHLIEGLRLAGLR